jgi:hypothetical protein
MVRISVEEVRAAYLSTGIDPARRDWRRCGLGVVAQARGVDLSGDLGNAAQKIARELSVELPYVNGFAEAFDGRRLAWPVRWDRVYRAGYEDGRRAADAVFDPLFVVEWHRRQQVGTSTQGEAADRTDQNLAPA